MSRYDEDTLVQQTTAAYMESQLGWTAVYAFNTETFGPESLLGRASDREVVLTRSLRAKLKALNPDLPDAAYDDAVRQVTATVTAQSLIATNREKYTQVRDGVTATFRNDKGEVVKQRLTLIDFDNPDNNEFLCVREFWVRGDLYRKRADIVGFVNGIPLLFMECKAMHRNLQAAFEENFSDYKDTIPHLLHHNALVIFGNGQHAKVGSITAKWKHFHDWKRLHEGDPGVVDNETLLKGICDRRNFLDLVENFILFDDSRGETQKIVAHNHQFLGVNQAIEAVKNRKARKGKLGVFWHTQGSGKSYSIAMFTRKVHRKLGGNFTFVMLTDRDDLDTQLYKTFVGCGIVNHDKDPCRPENGDELRTMLTEQKSYVFSMIQKFNKDVLCTERDDVIVVTDEAHRTQYGTLALNVRNGLPNANFIGFTGTPLFKDDEITRRVFGSYVSVYDFQRAVEDNATVPLYYDARGEKLGVSIGDLNERIAAKLAELEAELASAKGSDPEESQEGQTPLQKQIAWMKETRAVVIVSEEQGEVAKFRNWGLDIEPHRRLMKEGIELPESMRNKPEYRNKQRMDLDEAFKADEHPFRVAIVCAMWLTGFDVPSLATMYLDKSVVYDISKVDFERLRQEFARNVAKKTATMDLKEAIEKKLKRLMMQNPLRTDFQQHYETIVAEYNREKDRATIEKSFEAFLKFAEELNDEDRRAIREELDKESLAIFDLLLKPDLSPAEIKRIKKVAVELLATLKAEKLKVDQWRDKEATRDAVRLAIKDFLWSDQTGLPADYDQTEVEGRAEEVYRHVYRVYPTIPSPYFERDVVA